MQGFYVGVFVILLNTENKGIKVKTIECLGNVFIMTSKLQDHCEGRVGALFIS